jgi:hypothetical protein
VITIDDFMPVRCAGCAYTDGTVANRDELTLITRNLCELGGATFYCHANAVDDVLPREGKRICRGFADVQVRQVITGKEPAPWQRVVAEEGIRIMEEAEARAKRGQPQADALGQMRLLMRRASKRLER